MSRAKLLLEMAEKENHSEALRWIFINGGYIHEIPLEEEFGLDIADSDFVNRVASKGHTFYEVKYPYRLNEITNVADVALMKESKSITSKQADLFKRIVMNSYQGKGSEGFDPDTVASLRKYGLVRSGTYKPNWDKVIRAYRTYQEEPEVYERVIECFKSCDATPSGKQQVEDVKRLVRGEKIEDPKRKRRYKENGILDFFKVVV